MVSQIETQMPGTALERVLSPKLKVAIVCDFLVDYGGAERVLESMLKAFPQADLFALHHEPRALPATINTRITQVTPLSSWIRRLKLNHRTLAPLYPFFIEQFDFSHYELILSSSYFCAKAVLKPSTACHVSYCHTPFRQVWDRYHDYCREFKSPVGRAVFRLFAHQFRLWDMCSAQSVDAFLACSQKVAVRIKTAYQKPAQVIYPPVSLTIRPPELAPVAEPPLERYFLCISRLLNTYKRIDLLVQAIEKLPNHRLVVVGSGPDEGWLRELAGPRTVFLGQLNDPQRKADLLANAVALVIPGEEDFGIVALEALACGTPVVASRRSGAAEILKEGETAVLFDDFSVEALADALERAAAWDIYPGFDPDAARSVASRHTEDRFQEALIYQIALALGEFADRQPDLARMQDQHSGRPTVRG